MRPTFILLFLSFLSTVSTTRLKRGSYGPPQQYSPPSSYSPPISNYAPKPTYESPLASNYAPKPSYQPPSSVSNYGPLPSSYSRPYGQPEYYQNYNQRNNFYGQQQFYPNIDDGYQRPWWARQRGPQIPWWKRQQFMNQGGFNQGYPENFGGPQAPTYPQASPTIIEKTVIHRPSPPVFTEAPTAGFSEVPVAPSFKEKEYPEVPSQSGPPPPLPPTQPEYQEIPSNPPPARGIPAPMQSPPEYPSEPSVTPSIPLPPPPDPTPEYPTITQSPPLVMPKGFTLPPAAQIPDIPDPPGK